MLKAVLVLRLFELPEFDRHWYLAHSPDVANSGMDPAIHYWRHGRFEGRLPAPLQAAEWERALWAGDRSALGALQHLSGSSDIEGCWSAWALARWFAGVQDWPSVHQALQALQCQPLADSLFPHAGPRLLAVLAARETGQTQQAIKLLTQLSPEAEMEKALLQLGLLPAEQALSALNARLCALGLQPLRWQVTSGSLDALASVRARRYWGGLSKAEPLVSVIMPARNAAATILTALHSLLAQSWSQLEVIVVDDGSSDETLDRVTELAKRDSRIRLLRQDQSLGAYAARNLGLQHAQGAFITTHDADDWSHPQKIERQVQALLAQPEAMACLSWWARVDNQLAVHCCERLQQSLLQRNLSSLMFRRQVFTSLGFWDRVRAGADSEYWLRICRTFGEDAVIDVLPGVPLALGRVSADNLTQSPVLHWRTQYGGVRKAYLEAARAWQSASPSLYMPIQPKERLFAVPAVLLADATEQVRGSGVFDADWYRHRYPDVAHSGMDPALHYLAYGAAEGRDPGPEFSSSGYAWLHALPADVNPVIHLLQQVESPALPLQLPGRRPTSQRRPRILICAHAVQAEVFGAERSLLDVLMALERLGWEPFVALPAASNSEYVAAVQARAASVFFVPCPWWHADRAPLPGTLAAFKALLQTHHITALYANTVVLYEPLRAARECSIPVLTHARELAVHDPELCDALGSDAATLRTHVLRWSDRIIANSKCVAAWLDDGRTPIFVVPDSMDTRDFPLTATQSHHLRVALISSNHPKKGLDDFVAVSRLLAVSVPWVRCCLIGPENLHTARLKADGDLPPNLQIAGPASTPLAAHAEVDIVVNLSHVEESFGRTVAEAMAGGRAVVCYRWGGLPELVNDGETGFTVPLGDIAAVAERITQLVLDAPLRSRMGLAGRQRIHNNFGSDAFEAALALALPLPEPRQDNCRLQ